MVEIYPQNSLLNDTRQHNWMYRTTNEISQSVYFRLEIVTRKCEGEEIKRKKKAGKTDNNSSDK